MNLQIKAGMYPLWLCGDCRYTVLTRADSRCANCQSGADPPDLSWIHDPEAPKLKIDLYRIEAILLAYRDRENRS